MPFRGERDNLIYPDRIGRFLRQTTVPMVRRS